MVITEVMIAEVLITDVVIAEVLITDVVIAGMLIKDVEVTGMVIREVTRKKCTRCIAFSGVVLGVAVQENQDNKL